jgi:lipopolysaccharide export system protein LptA
LRPLKLLIIFLVSLSLLGMIPASPFAAKSKDKLKKGQENNPLEIKADKLRSENEGKKFIFTGNAVSTWGDLKIKSDILEVYANPESKTDRKKATEDISQASQDLDKIIAIGNVDIKKGDRRAKGDRAHYDNKKQIIVITGKPNAIAWEGENIIRGKKMTFYLEKDLLEVEQPILNIKSKNPSPAKKR